MLPYCEALGTLGVNSWEGGYGSASGHEPMLLDGDRDQHRTKGPQGRDNPLKHRKPQLHGDSFLFAHGWGGAIVATLPKGRVA